MNNTLHNILITWGFCSIITIVGLWLSSRIPFPNAGYNQKQKLKEYVLGIAIAPLAATVVLVGVFSYVCLWGDYFWNKIKDIEI